MENDMKENIERFRNEVEALMELRFAIRRLAESKEGYQEINGLTIYDLLDDATRWSKKSRVIVMYATEEEIDERLSAASHAEFSVDVDLALMFTNPQTKQLELPKEYQDVWEMTVTIQMLVVMLKMVYLGEGITFG